MDKINKKTFNVAQAEPLGKSVSYTELKLKGPEEEIKRLNAFAKENSIPILEDISIKNGIGEIKILSYKRTLEIVNNFPTLKATCFCEEWFGYQVYVLFSDSGYSVFNDSKLVGYFDGDADGGDGRWYSEIDILQRYTGSFEHAQTGMEVRNSYKFPYENKWRIDEYVYIQDGEYFKDDIFKSKSELNCKLDENDNEEPFDDGTAKELIKEFFSIKYKNKEIEKILNSYNFHSDVMMLYNKN